MTAEPRFFTKIPFHFEGPNEASVPSSEGLCRGRYQPGREPKMTQNRSGLSVSSPSGIQVLEPPWTSLLQLLVSPLRLGILSVSHTSVFLARRFQASVIHVCISDLRSGVVSQQADLSSGCSLGWGQYSSLLLLHQQQPS